MDETGLEMLTAAFTVPLIGFPDLWTGSQPTYMLGMMRRSPGIHAMMRSKAKFALGEVVRHRVHPFRGVIFDVDPTFSNTEEWWQSIPEENRPRKDQPFYHLLAENETSYYVAYVSEQNLVRDDSGEPVDHPDVAEMFGDFRDEGRYDIGGHLH